MRIFRKTYQFRGGNEGILLLVSHERNGKLIGPAAFVVRSVHLPPVPVCASDLQNSAHQTLGFKRRLIVRLLTQKARRHIHNRPPLLLSGNKKKKKYCEK